MDYMDFNYFVLIGVTFGNILFELLVWINDDVVARGILIDDGASGM